MARSYNPNLVKQHRCYRIDEVASLFKCHKNTVSRWLRVGLEPIDDSRPTLIHGRVLKDYLRQAKSARKKACKSDEMYCMRCKEPRKPLDHEVWWVPQTATKGRLVGCCETCGSTVNRFSKTENLASLSELFAIQFESDQKRISDSDKPALNGDFDGGD